ncbi:MOSC domain-containing protein [Pararhodobacter sp.]|uniref:MOSC domain-containing protein n=1 Tax=Pararhodobacter sp. TaxID=2127056 RepID=UPI002AFEBFAD|nr:MOSC domain-containing protein [Pararhodobacter sp.]
MPALKATEFEATILWLGRVENRDVRLPSTPLDAMELGFDGPDGESHGGMTRLSCSRVTGLYPRNTPIRNTRQLSVLSAEELDEIAQAMGLEALDPALLGASMVLRGIPDFTHIPPSSRLLAASGACLTVDMVNRPCTLPARPIEDLHAGFGARFKPAAKGRRGVTAWVEAEGRVALGDRLRLFVPDQPPWQPTWT